MLTSLGCSAGNVVSLNKNNHYFLNDQVDNVSTAIALSELSRLDKELPKGEPLYLILKTPGGSVIAGMDFIRAVQHLSRPITTVSIRSISMGFQIIQNLGKRLVVETGIIMTHPIAGNCGGRPPEVRACLNFMTQLADSLDISAAKRLKMSLKDYKISSSEEWYTVGQGAIDANMADQIVKIECDKEMNSKDRCPY